MFGMLRLRGDYLRGPRREDDAQLRLPATAAEEEDAGPGLPTRCRVRADRLSLNRRLGGPDLKPLLPVSDDFQRLSRPARADAPPVFFSTQLSHVAFLSSRWPCRWPSSIRVPPRASGTASSHTSCGRWR